MMLPSRLTLRWRLLGAALLLSVSVWAAPRKSIIAHNRDLMKVSTEDVWRNRGKFSAVGCDGVLLSLDRRRADGRVVCGRDVLAAERFGDAEFGDSVRFARECLAADGLRDSLALVSLVPQDRLAWTDDRAWELAANNVGAYARAAKGAGFLGVALNSGFGSQSGQFRYGPGDPGLDETMRLARARGRLFFGSLFMAFPDAKVLSLCLFGGTRGDSRTSAPGYAAKVNGNLWVPFLNGLLDVLPPGAVLIDGNATSRSVAERGADAYRMIAMETMGDERWMVEPENRSRYAAQVSVAFGLCVDSYDAASDAERRQFLCDLTDAASAADDLVWIYGKQGTLVDWDVKDHAWLQCPTWESRFAGYGRVLRTAGGGLEPFREGLLRGELRKLALEVRKGDEPGAFVYTNKNKTQRYTVAEALRPGDVVYVRFREKGRFPHLALTWMANKERLSRVGKSGRWASELFIPDPVASDDEWRWIDGRFVVPEGADGFGLLAWGPLAHRYNLAFEAIECYTFRQK